MRTWLAFRFKPPTTLTRVTDYVEEIVTFVEKIISNGFAYDGGDGNVWFDKTAFDGSAIKDDEWSTNMLNLRHGIGETRRCSRRRRLASCLIYVMA